MHDLERRLNRLEHQLTPVPSKPGRWVVAWGEEEAAAAEAAADPDEFLVIWKAVEPKPRPAHDC
jgi:hypothetical protein